MEGWMAHHVEIVLVLKAEKEGDYPGVRRGHEQVPLVTQMPHLVLHDHRMLDHGLEGKNLPGVSFPNQPHLAKGAPSDQGQGLGEKEGRRPRRQRTQSEGEKTME